MGKDSIHPKQAQILKVASRLTAPVTTRDLTSETNLSNNTVGYHAGELIEQGYLEKGEMLDVGSSNRANSYRLTDDGAQVAEEIMAPGETVEQLQQDVEDLQKKNKQLENELESFRSAVLERFTEVAEKIDEMDKES